MSTTLFTGLEGKLAVVTGSTKGIGFAIASLFAAHGSHVVVTGRSATEAQAAKERIAQATGASLDTLYAFAADLSTKEGTDSLIAQIDAIGVPVEILVNNSGTASSGSFFDETDEEWQRLYDVNVMSGVRLTRHFLKGMLERKTGRVIFSASALAARPNPSVTAYAVSKIAQVGLARALAELTRGTEVTVNSVLIAATASDLMDGMINKTMQATGASREEVERKYLNGSSSFYSLDRLQSVEEVANVFLFLASKQGLLVNGTAQQAASGSIRHVF